MQVVHKIQQVIATAALGVAVVAGALLPAQAYGGDLTIAAASDLNFAFKDLVAEYEKKTGERVKLTLGSSGNFYSQIENGAPFDLYFRRNTGLETSSGIRKACLVFKPLLVGPVLFQHPVSLAMPRVGMSSPAIILSRGNSNWRRAMPTGILTPIQVAM